MSSNPSILQFTMPKEDRDWLESIRSASEGSISLVAKRLCYERMGQIRGEGIDPSIDLKDIEDRLSRLEKEFGNWIERTLEMKTSLNALHDIRPRLSEIEDQLKQATGRSRSKQPSRGQNGRFIPKGGKG